MEKERRERERENREREKEGGKNSEKATDGDVTQKTRVNIKKWMIRQQKELTNITITRSCSAMLKAV